MQRRLRDQRVVVVEPEDARVRQRADDEGDRLQLRARLVDALLVDSERLHVEVVREVFEAALICNLRSEKEEAERDGGCVALC